MQQQNNQNAASDNAVLTNAVTGMIKSMQKAGRDDTTPAVIASGINEKALKTLRARLETVFLRPFSSDPLANDLGSLMFNEIWNNSETSFLAVEAGDDKLADLIANIAESSDPVLAIQGRDEYALEAQPLESRMMSYNNVAKAIKKRLAGNIMPTFMPTASAVTWIQVLRDFIADFDTLSKDKREEVLTETIKLHFPDAVINFGTSIKSIIDTVTIVRDNKKPKAFFDEFENSFEAVKLSDEKDKEASAITGLLGSNQLWLQIVKALAGVDRRALVLIDPRRARESSILTSPTLSVDPTIELGGECVNIEAPEGFDSETFDMLSKVKDKVKRADQTIDFVLDSETMRLDSARTKTMLLVHVLNWAGAEILFDKREDVSSHEELNYLTLPITEHVLGEPLFDRVTRAWYAFSNAQTKEFKFLESWVGYARARRTSRMVVKTVRTEILKQLKEDIHSFVKEVRETLREGASEGLTKASDRALLKFATYEKQPICYFADRNITCDTTVKNYAKAGTLTFVSDRAIGAVDVPKGASIGFSEGVLVSDPHEFNSVVGAGSMDMVGDMYNKIIALATPSAYQYNMSSDSAQIFSEIVNDYKSSMLRTASGEANNLMASELTPESKFTPLDDFHVQVVNKDVTDFIKLPSAYGEVRHVHSTVQSVTGAITIGIFSGERPELGSPFVTEMAKTIRSAADDLINRYSLKPIAFSQMESIKIDLTEKDEKYARRLSEFSNVFSNYSVDVDNIKSLLGAPSAPSELVGQFKPETFVSLKRYDFSVRTDALNVIQTVTSDLYKRLCSAHNKSVVDFVKIILTRSLNLAEQERFNDPIFASTVSAVLKSVADAVDTTSSEMLKVVFLNELLKLIK